MYCLPFFLQNHLAGSIRLHVSALWGHKFHLKVYNRVDDNHFYKDVSEKMPSERVYYLAKSLGAIFDKVSEPLYDLGPALYFMAAMRDKNSYKFTFYAVTEAEAFIAEPDAVPAIFENQEFMFDAVDGMGLDNILQSGKHFALSRCRLIPDYPACRLAVQQLQEDRPDLISGIHLIDGFGAIVPASSIVSVPVILS